MLSPMKKLGKIMEYFWLAAGVVALVMVIQNTSSGPFEQTKVYYLAPVLCFAMFFFRKFMNGKLAKMAEREEERKRSTEQEP